MEFVAGPAGFRGKMPEILPESAQISTNTQSESTCSGIEDISSFQVSDGDVTALFVNFGAKVPGLRLQLANLIDESLPRERTLEGCYIFGRQLGRQQGKVGRRRIGKNTDSLPTDLQHPGAYSTRLRFALDVVDNGVQDFRPSLGFQPAKHRE